MNAPKRCWNRKLIALVAMLLVTGGLYVLNEIRARDTLSQIAGRQQRLTGQASARLEQSLRQIEAGLRQIATSAPAADLDGRELAADFALLFKALPPRVLVALYLRDASGNILAEYPRQGVLRAGIPPHLLDAMKPGALSSGIIDLPAERLLRLNFPVCGRPRGDPAQLSALISLNRLVQASLGPSTKDDFSFLMDEGGRFLLHRNPSLTGHSFTKSVSAGGGNQDFFHYLSELARGQTGEAGFHASGLLGARNLLPAPPPMLLTCSSLQGPQGRWSLGLALDEEALAALQRGHEPFALLLGFLFLGTLAWVPASRLVRRPQELEKEREDWPLRLAELDRKARTAEQRYRHLLDNAGDAIFFIDPETGELQEINRRAEELLGYRMEEIRRLSPQVLFPGRHQRRYQRLVRRVFREGYGEESNLLFRRKDGQLFIGEVHARLGYLGEQRMIHGVFRDITGMRRIERELRHKNRNLQLMNDIAHVTAGSRDLQTMLQPVLSQVIGAFHADGGAIFLAEEKKTQNLVVWQGIDEEIRREIASIPVGEGMVGRVAATGLPRTSADISSDRRLYSEAVRRAGWRGLQAIPLTAGEKTVGVLFLFSRSRPVFSREEVGLLTAICKQVGTAVDGMQLFAALEHQVLLTRSTNRELERSRRKLRENLQALEEANRSLAQLDRMKSNFLALASHELRTPLTYVLSGAELLEAHLGDRLEEEQKRVLGVICQGGERLKEIVDDLLEVARIESRTLYLAREKVDLEPLLADLMREFESLRAERDLTCRLSPFPRPPALLLGDPVHLKRTFRRLLENAFKFTPSGGSIEISASPRSASEIHRRADRLRPFSSAFFGSEPASGYLQVTVADSGVGIDPEDHVRVFDKFYEIGDINRHSTSRTRFGGKGVGLGLTLVKGMVEAHGGMVWVESAGTGREAVGSSFHVLLPIVGEKSHGHR